MKRFWILGMGGAALALLAALRPGGAAEAPKKPDRRAPASKRLPARAEGTAELPRVPNPEPKPAEASETVQAPAAPALPSPPDWAREDPSALRTWLLSLSDADFARLEGTPEFSGLVERVFGAIHARHSDASASALELDDFLMRLNARVEAVQATRVR